MVETHIHVQMLSSQEAVSSPIPIKELECGGEQTLEQNTGLTEFNFSTEKIAVEIDLLEPKFLSVDKSAVKLRMELEMENGTPSSAKDQFLETESNSKLLKTPIFPSQESEFGLVFQLLRQKLESLNLLQVHLAIQENNSLHSDLEKSSSINHQ